MVKAEIYDSSIRYQVIEFFEKIEFWYLRKKENILGHKLNGVKIIVWMFNREHSIKEVKIYVRKRGALLLRKHCAKMEYRDTMDYLLKPNFEQMKI